MSAWLKFGSISILALGTAAGCNNDAPPSSSHPPTPGDLGPADTSYAAADPVPAPKAPTPGKKGGPTKEIPPAEAERNMNPDLFKPKEICLLPKLSMCSAYGEHYERIGSVPQFCSALGGEKAGSCPDNDRVARCLSQANVMSSYYSTGEKPYTKEAAEAKCNEKNWRVLP